VKKIIGLMFVGLVSVSYADQCAWNSKSVAQQAQDLIRRLAEKNNQEASVYEYCELCNDKVMKRVRIGLDADGKLKANLKDPLAAGSRYGGRAPGEKRSWELIVTTPSGASVDLDLAYTFVKVSANQYANVGLLSSCPANGVSTIIFTNGNDKKDVLSEKAAWNGETEIKDSGIPIADHQSN
jgi:hypothetical protein